MDGNVGAHHDPARLDRVRPLCAPVAGAIASARCRASDTQGEFHSNGRPVAWLLVAAVLVSACLPVTRPIIKIGLVAPFEGRYRDIGYEVIYAVRLAVREANAAGGAAGYEVELTALDDSGDPGAAAEQARTLATDPQVLGVIGDWLGPTTFSAAPLYAAEGLPYLATAASALPPAAYRLWLTSAALRDAAAGAELCPLPCDSLEDLCWLSQTRASGVSAAIFGPPLWGEPQFATLAGLVRTKLGEIIKGHLAG